MAKKTIIKITKITTKKQAEHQIEEHQNKENHTKEDQPKNICFYFQVHQPYRLKKYSVFDIGKDHKYFNDEKNMQIMEKVANKCYLPTNKLMLQLLKKHDDFKIAYSISGTALQQFKEHMPKVIESFQKLTDTKKVEMLDETYYHSLSFIYSKKEFLTQVEMHKNMIKKIFNQTPKVFRNTELIYNNQLSSLVEAMGYKAIIAEGADHVLGWRSPNYVYKPKTTKNLRLLLKNYKLSDDIAFRFSDKNWTEHPLTADKYASWLGHNKGQTINLFMDYETFGEHQWEDTGIFEFMKHLPEELSKKGITFKTPSELAKEKPVAELDIPNMMSWADAERDLSAWCGNKMQQSALEEIYKLEKEIIDSKNKNLVEEWRKLQTSDHFYYMCTKWFSDGDVHKYFNPYDSPYDAYITFMNILNDLKIRLKEQANIKTKT